jgi:octaprenyl-diphosphate synthase
MPIPNSLFNPRVVKSSDFLTSDYLQFFEGYLNDLLDELDINVRDLAKQVVLRGGKRIRPVLVFLCGSRNSDATENLLKASSVIELVHVATLVHDDILDNASIRRGNPTLHSLHSKHTSILLGDALFSFALEIATTFPDTTVCRIVSKATRDTCTGEIDQNLFVNDFEMSLDKYYSIIQNKTGALFSASCSIGAYLSGASSIVMDLVCDFGTSLGVNYQIYDDLVDTFGDKSSFDKTLGTDISSGKVTLPIIKLLESLSGNERNSVVSDLSQKTQNVDFLNYLGELFVKNSIHQACFDELQKQLSNSRSIASNIPEAMLSKNLSNFISSFDGKIDSLSKNLFPNFLALN